MLQLLRNSVLAKVIGLVLLTLVLCLPLSEIDNVNRGRGQSQQEAGEELANTYAGAQTVIGPLLVLPYAERWLETTRDPQGRITGSIARSKEAMHVVFPDKLDIDGTLLPQERYRGIFKIPFYTLKVTLTGGFAAFNEASVAHSETNSTIAFKAPFIAFHVRDLRGLDGSPALVLGGETLRFAQRVPGLANNALLADGIHAPLTDAVLGALRAGRPLPFELKLGLVGQETLAIVPVAEETTAHLTSPWAHPSFGGRFLAAERSITAQGFEARWRVSSLVTSARAQVRDSIVNGLTPAAEASNGAGRAVSRPERQDSVGLQSFDVSLAQPLNVYSMSTRAGKYGALFIGLVLMAAFMFELFRKLRLHPIQYGLVGLSIALFFLLLLAFSEKLAFGLAYAGAAGASVLLLAVYFSAVLGSARDGLSFGAFVALLYGALYGLLASESNALLLGALLIFGMLAAMMVATRKVDWYALGAGREAGAGPAGTDLSA